jgi:pyruvate/2-oxoglutarate dehydrogenase complex dihydrolipoamide dehydrogenase (E3) component
LFWFRRWSVSVCQGEDAASNALNNEKYRFSSIVLASILDTDPQIAKVGLTSFDFLNQDIPFEKFREDMQIPFLNGGSNCFLEVYVHRGSNQIEGAFAVGRYQGQCACA